MFLSLDFIYTPAADVDKSIAHHLAVHGAKLRWKVRAKGTIVACLQLADEGPLTLLADHLEGNTPVLVYRVGDYDAAVAELRANGALELREMEIPHGPIAEFRTPDGAALAVYELTRPEAVTRFEGRIDD